MPVAVAKTLTQQTLFDDGPLGCLGCGARLIDPELRIQWLPACESQVRTRLPRHSSKSTSVNDL
jgi:hypothetical protein